MLRCFVALALIGPIAHLRADAPPVVKGFPADTSTETLNDPKSAAKLADGVEAAYAGSKMPEAARMLLSILRGSRMGPGDGWFGPCETKYTWAWLAERCGVDPKKETIAREKFPGTDAMFARLDRNKDGRIAASDLDWSDENPYVQQASVVNRLFRRMDAQGDGKLTKDELGKFFDKAGRGKEFLSSDDLRDALLAGTGGGFTPGDAPTTAVLVRGLFKGEVGSPTEGPAVGDPAPDFELKTVDGGRKVRLSKVIGPKPVVLVTGNFTCGPFRSLFPDVDALAQRYKDEATFLMVYVREAHPTDGWVMESNTKVGVKAAQPKDFGEREQVAGQFCERLKPTMPVLVDEISDVAGKAYSGMPARLYVIDRAGKVAYKSGRGPFGFRAGEMEQALLMNLLDRKN